MSDLNKLVRATLKKYGDEAPVRFGVKKTTLDGYLKRGKFPLKLIEAIVNDQPISVGEAAPPEPEPQPPPPPRKTVTSFSSIPSGSPVYPYVLEAESIANRVEQIVKYIQGTVDIYLKQFAARIENLEKQLGAMRAGQMRAAIGISSLARPDENVPVQQTFTTNPHGNALDTGIAPTKEQVDAQANMAMVEGVAMPQAEIARPAQSFPDQPAYGFGWNAPRPRR